MLTKAWIYFTNRMHMCIDIWCTVSGGFTLSIYKYNYRSGIWVYLLVLSTTMFIINVN